MRDFNKKQNAQIWLHSEGTSFDTPFLSTFSIFVEKGALCRIQAFCKHFRQRSI